MGGYAVVFEGEWREADRETVRRAVEMLGKKLAEISGLGPAQAFNCLLGYVEFVAGDPPGIYDGYVDKRNPHRITLRPGHVRVTLVLHEIGHLITDQAPEEQSGDYLLRRYGIKVGRRLVTGPGRDGYSRNAGYRDQRNGYEDCTFPAHEHPASDEDGNNSLEDFADMVNSWVLDNLADNDAGHAIQEWIVAYLVGRLMRARP